MDFANNIKYKVSRLNVLEKIIAINLVVYLLTFFIDFGWFELPSGFDTFLGKPWAIVSYAFLHYDFWHILFNMLWLYVIGRMFLNLFSAKTAINIYFLGAMSGGFLFMLCYSLFPSVFGNSSLVGASAAVRALLIFLCAYMPNQEMRFFTFTIKLWHIGVAIVLLDVIGVFAGIQNPATGNAGGNLAHLGGALLGYFYAKQLLKGDDI
ncbi:MAG TPA: rhomboid family intramembrane serine protease, partial [Mariniflexile sp.]|nr:rhomboid family intramembrane serine protease [Mariniflexile sp.]